MKQSAKDKILQLLESCQCYLAIHEMELEYQRRFYVPIGYSENCLATRCPELAKEGKLVSRKRVGKNYKEWNLAPMGQQGLI